MGKIFVLFICSWEMKKKSNYIDESQATASAEERHANRSKNKMSDLLHFSYLSKILIVFTLPSLIDSEKFYLIGTFWNGHELWYYSEAV